MNKMDDYMISVIIPTYNRADTLKATIASVTEQSYKNLEIIIIDDASIDNTYEIVKSINDKRIIYVKNKFNLGASSSRNIGINMAQGAFIAFQDSADIWKQHKLEKQIDIMKKMKNIDVVFCRMEFTTENNGKQVIPAWSENIKNCNENIYETLLYKNIIDTPTLLVRSNILKEINLFDENMPRFQDWDLCIRLAQKYNFYFVDEVLSFGKYRKDSISSDWKKAIIAGRRLVDKYKKNMMLGGTLIYHITNFYHYVLNVSTDISDIENNIRFYKKIFDDKFLSDLGVGQPFFDLQNKIVKFHKNYQVTSEWLRKNICKENISIEYLKNKKIIIYGFGVLGKLLCEEIRKEENIQIVGIIDKNMKKYNDVPYKILSIDSLERYMELDIIIVTPIWDFIHIKETLQERICCEIVSLEKIINKNGID